VGPFEEEEEEMDIASDIVKVKGDDPSTPDSRRGNKARWHVGYHFLGTCSLAQP